MYITFKIHWCKNSRLECYLHGTTTQNGGNIKYIHIELLNNDISVKNNEK